MQEDLAGRVAIVTGAAGGIGRAVAERFATLGARVVIADLDEERGEEAAAAIGDAAAFCRTDVASVDSLQGAVDTAVQRFGGLHVMCNNAGISSSFRRLLDNDLRDFHRVMGVNLFGVMAGTRAAARHMATNGGGSIINTTSMGALTGGSSPIVYRTSKAAVIQFSRSAATDLAEYGIRVNCIAPGHIATGFTNYDLGPVIARSQPLQRQGTSDDVAEAFAFLASDASIQITGVVLPVDGGTTAGPPEAHVRELMAQDLKLARASGGADAH